MISFIFGFSQTIFVSGKIESNSKWSADTVKVIGNIEVPSGIILQIDPGVYIEFQGYFGITLNGGMIKANGFEEENIDFTINDTTGYYKNLNSNDGAWAGIRIFDYESGKDTSRFSYCNFSYGKKYSLQCGKINGGALYVTHYNTLIIENCKFISNTVICPKLDETKSKGGAIYCQNVKNIEIRNSTFKKNKSLASGGAIQLGVRCPAVIENNLFENNKALVFYENSILGSGAAICSSDAYTSSPIIRDNYFFNNVSLNGVIYTSNRNSQIYNNIICNNLAIGIFDGHQLSTSKIYNNTIANNKILTGGAINIFSSAWVYHNICWNNLARFPDEYDDIEVSSFGGVNPVIFNNCVQYGDGGIDAIYEDPRFVDPSSNQGFDQDAINANWGLQNTLSPCINKGKKDTTGLFIPDFDILKNIRVFDGRIDIGAIENQYPLVVDKMDFQSKMPIFYPNPGSEFIIVDLPVAKAKFELISSSGQIVIKNILFRGKNNISTKFLNKGIYIIKVVYDNIVVSVKWVKF